ncbi:MAG: hypothetical protein ABSE77_08440, partial [Acidimicrobiales bacterium]
MSEPLYHKVSFTHIDGITENTEAIEEAFLLQLLVVLMITSYVRAVAGASHSQPLPRLGTISSQQP